MKQLVPILLIIASIGVFYMVINPHYSNVKDLRVQSQAYDAAIAQATAVVSKRSDLVAKKNSFSQADLDRLNKMLPDYIDPIRYIVDLNALANRYNTNIKDIRVVGDAQKSTTDSKPYGTMSVSFGVETQYNNFLQFLSEVEQSLKIMDVSSLVVNPSDVSDKYQYSLTVKSYWLKP